MYQSSEHGFQPLAIHSFCLRDCLQWKTVSHPRGEACPLSIFRALCPEKCLAHNMCHLCVTLN